MHDFVKQLSGEHEVFNRDNVLAVVVWVQVETGPRSGQRGFMCRISAYGVHRETGEIHTTFAESEKEAKELAEKVLADLKKRLPKVLVTKSSLEACGDYRYKLPQLAVRSTNHMPINNAEIDCSKSSLACAMCDCLLGVWKMDGCVSLVNRPTFVSTSTEALAFTSRNVTAEEAEEVLDSWIQEGYMKQIEDWLVPQGKLLQCASPEEVEPGTAWNCLVVGHMRAMIVIE